MNIIVGIVAGLFALAIAFTAASALVNIAGAFRAVVPA